MDYAGLIASYGYAAVFVGTLIEGETALALAGFAAHRGYLALDGVIVAALAGSVLGDQIAFAAGRRWGNRILERWPKLAAIAAAAKPRIERNATWFILANRFMYGLRLAGPIAIGMSAVPWHRFLALNIAGAAVWAVVIAMIGYAFREILGRLLDDLRQAEVWVFGVALVVLLVVTAVRFARR